MTISKIPGLDIQMDMRGSWASVRDQGLRGSCLACATSDAHARSQDRSRPLSAEFLFFHAGQLMPGADVSAGLTFVAVERALREEGQPDEAEWPYMSTQPTHWHPPIVTQLWHGAATSASKAVSNILTALDGHQAVVIGIRLTQEFLSLTSPFLVPAIGKGFGGHAVLAVGWARSAHQGELLLIRNSWGSGWADSGYAWLPTAYLADKLIGFTTVRPLKTH